MDCSQIPTGEQLPLFHFQSSQSADQGLKTVNKRFYLFLERGEGTEKEGEKQCVVASHVAPTGALARNPGMYLDWESNQRPFGSQPALNALSYTSPGENS